MRRGGVRANIALHQARAAWADSRRKRQGLRMSTDPVVANKRLLDAGNSNVEEIASASGAICNALGIDLEANGEVRCAPAGAPTWVLRALGSSYKIETGLENAVQQVVGSRRELLSGTSAQCEQDVLSAAEDAVAEVDEAGEGAGVGERGSAAAGSTYVRTSTC